MAFVPSFSADDLAPSVAASRAEPGSSRLTVLSANQPVTWATIGMPRRRTAPAADRPAPAPTGGRGARARAGGGPAGLGLDRRQGGRERVGGRLEGRVHPRQDEHVGGPPRIGRV